MELLKFAARPALPGPETFPAQLSLSVIIAACDQLRVALAQSQSVAEAYRLWRFTAALEKEVAGLSNLAADRCDDLLGVPK